MKVERQIIEALARTCLVLALACTLLPLSGCALGSGKEGSTMVEPVRAVAASLPTTPAATEKVSVPVAIVGTATGAASTADRAATATTSMANAIARITVSYRLDPWLISGNYGGGFWVSPPIFGPAAQAGSTFVLEVRAHGLDPDGRSLDISPSWIPSDPEMVMVSPDQGSDVTITVQRAGQSSLSVTAQGVSQELTIKAAFQDNAILVEIAR